MDIAAWLRSLGLEQYEPAFRANENDERVLPSLTTEDLREIGVVPIGHRRRLLDAIAAVGSRTGAPVGRGIPTMPRFQPPPRRTQHADFPHCAPPFASPQGLWDLSYRGNFRSVVSHSIAVEQS